MTDKTTPDTLAWKIDFLQLAETIETFQEKWRKFLSDFQPPVDDPSRGAVTRLLHYHLDRFRELLHAEVNGGLDESYLEEWEKINGR